MAITEERRAELEEEAKIIAQASTDANVEAVASVGGCLVYIIAFIIACPFIGGLGMLIMAKFKLFGWG